MKVIFFIILLSAAAASCKDDTLPTPGELNAQRLVKELSLDYGVPSSKFSIAISNLDNVTNYFGLSLTVTVDGYLILANSATGERDTFNLGLMKAYRTVGDSVTFYF